MAPSSEPSASSPFAGAAFLDLEAVLGALRSLAERLRASDSRVLRIVLFGSLATGRATSRSDADILIVLRSHPAPARERIPEYLAAFLDAPVPVDVFPFTDDEITARRARGDRFLETVEREGVKLLS